MRVLDGEGNNVGETQGGADGGEPDRDRDRGTGRTRRQGSQLEVIIEPTGPAWLPIAVFFSSRGHRVYRVSSAESADLRRYLSKHAKTNGIDADTLARIPLFHPAGVRAARHGRARSGRVGSSGARR